MAHAFQIKQSRRAILLLSIAPLLAGCQQNSAPNTKPNPPAAATGQAATKPTSGSIPQDVVEKVEKLIQLNEQYCELTSKIQDAAAFREKVDELSRLDQEASSVTEDIMIAEAKLSAAQKSALDRELFTPRAQPSIDRKRQERERVQKLVQ